eukprot:Gb_29123 [translate_table: standard]
MVATYFFKAIMVSNLSLVCNADGIGPVTSTRLGLEIQVAVDLGMHIFRRLSTMVQVFNTLKSQPGWVDDLMGVVPQFLCVVDTMYQQCCSTVDEYDMKQD